MDLTKKASCGIDKCFFRSLQNETIGYLVAGGSQFRYMEDAHELAISIQKEFDAKHFSLENARKIEVTETFQNLLNELVYQANRDLEGWEQQPVYFTDDRTDERGFVAVQKVQVVPEPNLFLALAGQNRQVMLKHIDKFRTLIPDKKAFEHQYRNETERIRKVLEKYPKLRYDFQGMLDIHGNFYFMDIWMACIIRKSPTRKSS